MISALSGARAILECATPLKRDCGKVCGAACCSSLEGEETGMLLFPGEKEIYDGKAEWRIRETAMGPMVLCPGQCRREERPLACRMFPLLPYLNGSGEVRVVTDQRARAVCPLARQGKQAMAPAFIDAVRQAGELLAGEGEQAAFLRRLAGEQDELKALRRKLGGE